MKSEPQRQPHLADQHAANGCPACKAARLTRIPYPSADKQWSELSVVVCKKCGFGFVPEINFDLDDYYRSQYGKSHRRRGLGPNFFADIDANVSKKVVRSRWHAKMLSERFGNFHKVLDVGAGPGFFLHYAKASEKYAIESDELSKPLLQSIGVTILDRLNQVDAPDLIVMSHSLEHFMVNDYAAFLREAIATLRSGGLLLVEVPHWGFLNKKSQKSNGKGHEPHTLFFSGEALLLSVTDAELVYFHDESLSYPISSGQVDWSAGRSKETHASSLMAIWRKPS